MIGCTELSYLIETFGNESQNITSKLRQSFFCDVIQEYYRGKN